MPTVLHVLPADATLSCPGLEDWLTAGAGVGAVLMSDDPAAWPGREVLDPPPTAAPWARIKPLAALMPREAHPWVGFFQQHRIGMVHLHDTTYLADACAAAERLDLPVVLSWPRGGSPEVPFERLSRVLVTSLAQRDRLIAVGCPEDLLAVAPVPVARHAVPMRRQPAKGQPLRWVSAALAVETQSLALVLEAFMIFQQVGEVPSTLRVLTTAHLAAEAEGLIEELGLSAVACCDPVESHADMRQAFAEAHLGVFPLEPAEPDLDAGLTWPAWVAASTALPLVLGPEGATDGFRDGQEAVIAELDPGAIARKMHFLSQRPFAWPNLGQQAARYATGAVDFQQACQVPYQVYKELVRSGGS